MSPNANEFEANVVNTSSSTIQLPTILPQACLLVIALLIVMNAVIVASIRNVSSNKNGQHEADDLVTESKSNSSSPLPTQVLRHCLSFLGSSDNYYFFASVSKDFKTAVEELYGEYRNTSAESITATVSTCNHVFDLIMGGTDLTEIEKGVLIHNISAAVFRNERIDIFERSIKPLYEATGMMNQCALFAITHNSTEIMRLAIKDTENVRFLKEYELQKGVFLASCAPSVCDVGMIKELIDHGVDFNGESLVFALQRDDLATFEYLLDVVKVYTERERQAIIRSALSHRDYADAFEMLMRKGFIRKFIEFLDFFFDFEID